MKGTYSSLSSMWRKWSSIEDICQVNIAGKWRRLLLKLCFSDSVALSTIMRCSGIFPSWREHWCIRSNNFTRWPFVGLQTGPCTGRARRRPKKKIDHSRLVDDRFNDQGTLHRRLVLGGFKMSRSPHPPSTTLGTYTEALTELSQAFSLRLSQGWILKTTLTMGTESRMYIPRMGGGWAVRSLQLLESNSWASW